MKKVEITFLGEQRLDGEKDNCRLKAVGTLRKTERGFVLKYTEPDSEMGNSKSVIEILRKNYVELKRTGLYETVFKIEENKVHPCLYKTPFGETKMQIAAKKVVANINENGGKIELYYRIENNTQIIGENALIMEVKVID
ncbi:MAG: DUF1934 domain-containing protein [Acutalibacteraceae bacterium]